MARPEHVKCENCVFWRYGAEIWGEDEGLCQRFPPRPSLTVEEDERTDGRGSFSLTVAESWCGEFRAEWPENPAP